jgi:undecaprenyl-phosphate 4-deoxy-4-formamido-L-arabinose transferase
MTAGVPSIMVAIAFFAGVQLLILGLLGEYLGRLFLNQSGVPQFVVRYIKEGPREHE